MAEEAGEGEEGSQSPPNRFGGGIDLEPGDVVPDEFTGAANLGGDDGFARGPAFEGGDAEGFVAAGQAHDIAGLVEVDQRGGIDFCTGAKTRP